MPVFQSDGVEIAYEVTGDGDPVLLAHGFASNARVNWVDTGWVRFLERAGYRVITFDFRGHGASAKLYDQALYAQPHMPEDMRRLLDHLHVERADVMGYSMGARMTAFLALRHPARVRSAIFGGLGINMVRGLGGTQEIAGALEADGAADVEHPTGRVFRAFAQQTRSDLKALAACMRSARASLTAEMVARFACPVLIVVGSADSIGGSASELAQLIPGARAIEIPERDHMRTVGDRRYKEGVLEFLKNRP